MKKKNLYLKLLTQNIELFKQQFGVKSMMLFGSVARGEDTPESDVDLFIDMPPKLFQIMDLEDFIKNLLGCKIDIIRKRASLNPFLLKEIEKDGIVIFQ